MFADAIEASAKNRPVRVPVSAREITEEAELIEFMEKWEKANVGNKLNINHKGVWKKRNQIHTPFLF